MLFGAPIVALQECGPSVARSSSLSRPFSVNPPDFSVLAANSQMQTEASPGPHFFIWKRLFCSQEHSVFPSASGSLPVGLEDLGLLCWTRLLDPAVQWELVGSPCGQPQSYCKPIEEGKGPAPFLPPACQCVILAGVLGALVLCSAGFRRSSHWTGGCRCSAASVHLLPAGSSPFHLTLPVPWDHSLNPLSTAGFGVSC